MDRLTTPLGYCVLFLVLFSMIFLSRSHRLHHSNAVQFEGMVVLEIEEPSTIQELLSEMQQKGVKVKDRELNWASGLLGWRRVQPGYYRFSEPVSYETFLSRLARGLQDHKRIVIPSGTRPEQLAGYLGRELLADSSAFAELFTDESELAIERGLTGHELFARMLPDQYDLFWTWQPIQVARRLLDEFERRVALLEEQAGESDWTLEDRLTLASIVEWEAGAHDEKAAISGLYKNRLQRGMRLQADPTILYALGEHRRLFFRDYELDHPFNTYRHAGLPPGPITNPDIHSLRAAYLPESHTYLYMVATPEGRHRFSRTYQEHQEASRDWRRWIEEQTRIGAERSSN